MSTESERQLDFYALTTAIESTMRYHTQTSMEQIVSKTGRGIRWSEALLGPLVLRI